MLVDLSSSVADSRSRARSASQFVHKKKSLRIYTSMHSGGLELTKLAYYTRLEDNPIRHRGDYAPNILCILSLDGLCTGQMLMREGNNRWTLPMIIITNPSVAPISNAVTIAIVYWPGCEYTHTRSVSTEPCSHMQTPRYTPWQISMVGRCRSSERITARCNYRHAK